MHKKGGKENNLNCKFKVKKSKIIQYQDDCKLVIGIRN